MPTRAAPDVDADLRGHAAPRRADDRREAPGPAIPARAAQGHHRRRTALLHVGRGEPPRPRHRPPRRTYTHRTMCSVERALELTCAAPQVDDSPNPLNFSQTFQLIPDSGSYYVYVLNLPLFPMNAVRRYGVLTDGMGCRFNDIFRLNYS
ncbi:hypothetical protein EVG20_g7140 [Dentipellis fragilis]|uniref:Uncharacterized protein n=1 Tax=Dentipellis fragilis TaxID=205917 RepID=A0A4Y9YHM7_9AGAM|nr:hypothetical protein EVG20_g7140 [Dentipellis fragilis]